MATFKDRPSGDAVAANADAAHAEGFNVWHVGQRFRGYPRSGRVLGFLTTQGFNVLHSPFYRDQQLPTGRKFLRSGREIARLLNPPSKTDFVVLAEFNQYYAPFAWIGTRLRGATLVVDGFVGSYETYVDDRGEFSTRSPMAWGLRFSDYLYRLLADAVLVDTPERRMDLERMGATAFHLPVGSITWPKSVYGPPKRRRLLYYGNYHPLNGVEKMISALSTLQRRGTAFDAIFVGDGATRSQAESLAAELKVARLDFIGPQSLEKLSEYVAAADVILGVFGDSYKARTVIPNKVWQGVAAGRTVVTRHVASYDAWPASARDFLITTRDENSRNIADALERALLRSDALEELPPTAALEEYVAKEYERSWRQIVNLHTRRRTGHGTARLDQVER